MFITHDIRGQEVLWIFRSEEQRLTGWGLTLGDNFNNDAIQRFEYRAISAIPIRSTRYNFKDVLILQPEGSLALWIGTGTLIPCLFPPDSWANIKIKGGLHNSNKRRRTSISPDKHSNNCLMESDSNIPDDSNIFVSPTRSFRMIGLSDPTCNSAHIKLSNSYICKAVFDFKPNSEFVRSCLNVIPHALPFELYEIFISRFYRYNFGMTTSYNDDEEHCNSEWFNFLVTLLSFCGNDLSVVINETKISPWEQLLASDYHEKMKSNTLLQSIPSGTKNYKATKWNKILHTSKKLFFVNHTEPTISDYMGSLLLALHLIYEDSKLNVIHSSCKSDLAQLLFCISKFISWHDYTLYYIRDTFVSNEISLFNGNQ